MTQRTKLLACRVKGCPEPENEMWHVCWVAQYWATDHDYLRANPCFGGVTHQHTKKRSQGGKVIDACLCAGHHDRIDNGLWGNKIVNGEWVAYDENHVILARRSLNGSASESETLEGAGMVARSSGSDTAPLGKCRHGVPLSLGIPCFTCLNEIPGELTRAECIRLAQQLRAERERNPWASGDLLNAAERIDDTDNSWADNGDSLLDILGIQPETASNYQRVCRHVDMGLRDQYKSLSFGHFQSAYKRPDMEQWLKLAVDEGLSVSELRRRIRGPRATVKRWTLEQLRAQMDEWCSEYLDEKKLVKCATCTVTREWLDWLGGQGGNSWEIEPEQEPREPCATEGRDG